MGGSGALGLLAFAAAFIALWSTGNTAVEVSAVEHGETPETPLWALTVPIIVGLVRVLPPGCLRAAMSSSVFAGGLGMVHRDRRIRVPRLQGTRKGNQQAPRPSVVSHSPWSSVHVSESRASPPNGRVAVTSVPWPESSPRNTRTSSVESPESSRST